NILGGIIGYTDLAIMKTDKESPVKKYLDQVLTASRRATDLVKQILTFSRSEDQEKKEPIQLSLIVKEALKLLRSTLPENIEIISKIEAKDCFILANPTQFHQVVMNLLTNAAHAMKDKGGIIEVKLTEEILEDALYKGLKTGPHLRLTVSDTGCGIKPEHLDKIFDPFFTTKNPGEGTGMGLAVVHGIVEGHQGHISVFSKENEGTTFSILVPIIVDVIHKQEEEDMQLPKGNESILLVEDDDYLIEAEKKMLEELGYKVTAVTSAVEAFEIFQKLPHRFDIIITDYALPKMTGVQLINKIRTIKPDIPVIVCTGYSQVVSLQKTDSMKIGEIIMKPIKLSYFANSIRRVIEKN
ncbi:MAG: response regulator, partial [Candidatus Aminicenantes bacterium]